MAVEGPATKPRARPATVTWRYMGAHTVHCWENREAWTIAASRSAGWMVRSALAVRSVETVG